MRALRGALVGALVGGLTVSLAGCMASAGGKAPNTGGTAVPPAASTSARAPTGSAIPRSTGTVVAPWDTAARSRDTRRDHVYPKGESAIGKRLVDSIPDPARAGLGASASTECPAAPPPSFPAASSAPPPAPVSGDCWEVQLLVTTDKGRAEDVRDEAGRRLDISAWVKSEGAIHKVRAGGCLTHDGAARLAERVRQQGYPEAFRVPRER